MSDELADAFGALPAEDQEEVLDAVARDLIEGLAPYTELEDPTDCRWAHCGRAVYKGHDVCRWHLRRRWIT